MPDHVCRHCGIAIIWLEFVAQWWHMTGINITHAYRGCRDAAGKLTGAGVAEPKETAA